MKQMFKAYLSNMLKKLKYSSKFVCKSLRFAIPYILSFTFCSFGINSITIIVAMVTPPLIWIATSVINIYFNRNYAGDDLPVPVERFTEYAGEGEIKAKRDRLEEMVMYVFVLEEWLHDNGYFK